MKQMRYIPKMLALTLLSICCTTSCALHGSVQPVPAYWPTQYWKSSTPETQGMDSVLFAKMLETIQTEDIHLHSLLIVRNGYLVKLDKSFLFYRR